jgi:hypothetical protein
MRTPPYGLRKVTVGCQLAETQSRWGRDAMPRFNAVALLVAWIALVIGVAALGTSGEQRTALLKQYWGKITSVRIDKCGRRPGLCEGMIFLAQRDGGQLALAIRPGTWIKRGDRLVLLEELGAGNDVHVQAIEIAEGGGRRATTVDVSANP